MLHTCMDPIMLTTTELHQNELTIAGKHDRIRQEERSHERSLPDAIREQLNDHSSKKRRIKPLALFSRFQ